MPRRLAFLAVVLAPLAAAPARALAIVGGQPATQPWPAMAGMELRAAEGGETDWSFRCGGALVAPDVALTAAHCVERDDGKGVYAAPDLRFLLGSHRRDAGGERIGVVRVVQHPDYASTSASDVALLQLERPATLASPMRLAQPGEASLWAPGVAATVIGWGATVSGGPATDELREVQVTIRSDDECGTFNRSLQPATELCAGERTGLRDACQGDSGGPLMVRSGSEWVQVGVVSSGVGCAFPTQYGVYAEAAGDALRPWIEATTRSLTASPAASGSAPPSSSPPALPLRLTLPVRMHRGRTIVVRGSHALRTVRITVRRGGRVVARGTRRGAGSRRVRVRLTRTLRPGRYRLTARAAGASATRTVRVTR